VLEKSKLAQHAYIEGYEICWNEAKVLQIEPNVTYRKYKKSAHMSLIDHPISQPSLDNSPIWTPVITAEIKKLQLCPVWIEWENLCFYVDTIQRICVANDDFCCDSSLIQGFIRVFLVSECLS
jgi:hypothetical protein